MMAHPLVEDNHAMERHTNEGHQATQQSGTEGPSEASPLRALEGHKRLRPRHLSNAQRLGMSKVGVGVVMLLNTGT